MAGGGGRTVSRARALGGNKKLLSVARERAGPESLGHGDLMRDARTRGMSLISLRVCVPMGMLRVGARRTPWRIICRYSFLHIK
jgi:hypothetical protein